MNLYQIRAFKHYWVESDPVPVPHTKDVRYYTIMAKSEKEAIKKVEADYGSGERVGKDGNYINNPDGSWTLINVVKVEL